MKTLNRITYGIIDDDTAFVSLLIQELKKNPRFEKKFLSFDSKDGIVKFKIYKPKVVLIDLHMPVKDGIELSKLILEIAPETLIIGISGYLNDENIWEFIQAGCCCPLDKSDGIEEIVEAIPSVVIDGYYYTLNVQRVVNKNTAKGANNSTSIKKKALSDKEWKFLDLYFGGKKYAEIASELGKSPRTIEKFKNRIIKKIGFQTEEELHNYYLKKKKF
jgi:DNA-binding NarL/FixJ family response regulator